MTTYLEATAIDPVLSVEVTTAHGTTKSSILSTEPFNLVANGPILKLIVDGINCSDYVYQQERIQTNAPFFLWYHQISGHGWLLS